MTFTTADIAQRVYYTTDHDRIEFQKDHALVGVSDYKLKGIGKILQIDLKIHSLDINKGQELGIIISEDYQIPFHMPVDGKLIDQNEYIISNPHLLTDPSLSSKWLLKIRPENFKPEEELLPQDQYLQLIDRRIA